MRVLYVEDDMALAKSVALTLRKAGHDCHTTSQGADAINLAKQNAYDVIVLDVMLPDIDGYEVVERLRADGIHTPYLIQSGLVERDNPANGRAFGVDQYLIKPFRSNELIERLEQAAESGGPARETGIPGVPDGEIPGETSHKRGKTIQTGEILYDSEKSRCMVLNFANGGAAIRLPGHMTDCPDYFTLKMQTGDTYDCQVCWRLRDKIGVKFSEA